MTSAPDPNIPGPLPANVLLVIPVYNHPGTLRRTAERALAVHPHLLVMDDGSSDAVAPLLEGLPLTCLRHETNLGKGRAIRTAADWAAQNGYSHIITLDADGQHNPDDARLFTPFIVQEPKAIIVGARDFTVPHIPFASRFGRSFSGFWMRVQTGVAVSDMQSGFRAYPVAVLQNVVCSEDRFAFEIEILVRSAWAGFPILNVPIGVYYPPPEERISHFKALADNFRISMLNTRLTMRAMLPIPPHHMQLDKDGHAVNILRPVYSLRHLLSLDSSPAALALAAALGVGLAVLPLYGLHTILILLLCGFFRLNKLLALALNQLAILPLFPAMSIELGHFIIRGQWLTEISWQTLAREAGHRLLDWAIGSLTLAPVIAGLTWIIFYFLAKVIHRSMRSIPAGQGPDNAA